MTCLLLKIKKANQGAEKAKATGTIQTNHGGSWFAWIPVQSVLSDLRWLAPLRRAEHAPRGTRGNPIKKWNTICRHDLPTPPMGLHARSISDPRFPGQQLSPEWPLNCSNGYITSLHSTEIFRISFCSLENWYEDFAYLSLTKAHNCLSGLTLTSVFINSLNVVRIYDKGSF